MPAVLVAQTVTDPRAGTEQCISEIAPNPYTDSVTTILKGKLHSLSIVLRR